MTIPWCMSKPWDCICRQRWILVVVVLWSWSWRLEPMKVMDMLNDFTLNYWTLFVLALMPMPFPFLQMAQTFLFLWTFTIPFVLRGMINEAIVPMILSLWLLSSFWCMGSLVWSWWQWTSCIPLGMESTIWMWQGCERLRFKVWSRIWHCLERLCPQLAINGWNLVGKNHVHPK